MWKHGTGIYRQTKLLRVTVDNRLMWREHVDKVQKSFSSQIHVLKKMSYLPPKLLEKIYFKTMIPQLTYCIAVWGNCPVAIFTEIERLHNIKVTSIIHKVPEDILDCNVLDHIKWQDLGYLYKRRIAIEVFTAKQGLNNRLLFLPFLTFTKSKHKDLLLELITKMKENRS